eukprot:4983474-Amphidinium_carterae.1
MSTLLKRQRRKMTLMTGFNKLLHYSRQLLRRILSLGRLCHFATTGEEDPYGEHYILFNDTNVT